MSDNAHRSSFEVLHGVVATMTRVDARFRFLGAIALDEVSIKNGDRARRYRLLKHVVRERMRSGDGAAACGLLWRKRALSGCDDDDDDDDMLVFKRGRDGCDDSARVDEKIDRWLTRKITSARRRKGSSRNGGRRTKINTWVRDMRSALRVWVDVHVYVYDRKDDGGIDAPCTLLGYEYKRRTSETSSPLINNCS
ncbi:hypothetical protein CYMTET_49758 [Cymbomonas tetramitiformis]|uniref:Uncharacterized protein n=1 Tax=Cymbomonas tetramitiformis TaxID=36881 RepID=A0AAE0ETU0_9CHLO|nr:hypothetical protein CYMTET_49758 [Cymbomonas tetramitiformis]